MNNTSIRHIESVFALELAALYDNDEARSICRLIIVEELAWSSSRILAERDSVLTSDEAKRILDHLPAISRGTPVQYELGYGWFMNMKLHVSPSVLIPRPETEELVQYVYQHHPSASDIIDVGTGSGCIALSLKKHIPNAQVYALDISAEALEIARKNAIAHDLDIQFIQGDILEWDAFFHPAQQYDIVVSNPPYITQDEQVDMHLNVLQYEPHIALFVENEAPLLFYAHIASFAKRHLRAGGYVYAEINASLGRETRQLFEKNGFEDVIIRQDMQGKDRFITARKPL